MNLKEEQICRLFCYNVTENAFETIGGVLSEIFDVLLLKRVACIYPERSILCPVVENPESRFQLNSVYKGGQIIETAVDKKFKVCRLCMKLLDEINFMSMDLLMNNTIFTVLMPDIDLNIAKDSVICISYKQSLEHYFRFMWQCLNAEEIKSHKMDGIKDIPNSENKRLTKQVSLEESGNTDSGIVDLLSLIGYIQKYAIRKKANVFDVTGSGLMKTEDLEIKDEGVFIDEESPKRSFNNKKAVYKCERCGFKINTKRNLKYHTRIHVEAPQIRTHVCLHSPYVAKYSSHLVTHMITHMDDKEIQIHKCMICDYESKYKKDLKAHMRTHKNTIEVQMYKCLQCTYKTKLKNNLKEHILSHKDPSELIMCQCTICTFETKYKKSLKNHMLSHQINLEGGIYKCTVCIYKTNRESSFKSHLLTHDNSSKSEMYKCATCGYQTKVKSSFKKYLLVHKELSQIET